MSAAFNKKTSAQANALQRKKYKNLAAEMARRANMRRTYGTGANKENYPDLSREMSRRAKIRWAKNAGQEI